MFELYAPLGIFPEKSWVISVIFAEFLDLAFSVEESTGDAFTIRYGNQSLILPDVFFSNSKKAWLSCSTLPQLPLEQWDIASFCLKTNLVDRTLPILYGQPGFYLDNDGNGHLSLDVFGSAFFMLSRYEELVVTERDEHDRFPATASIAYKAGFLDRPIVDEYVEILWTAMQRIWPGLVRRPRQLRTLVSCDVDTPYVCLSKSLPKTIKAIAGDLIKRKSPSTALQTLNRHLQVRCGNYSQDPYIRTINWMMDVNEKAGNTIEFYFIPEHLHTLYDGCYTMNEPVIRDLLRHIHARGHIIGLHASYTSYDSASQTCREANILRTAMEKEGLYQTEMGGRQHYLRWKTPITARNWEAAGMAYDSTLSFADRPGFRCGTSKEYFMYDLEQHRAITVKQRPLVLMECSIIDDAYMGFGYTDEALDYMKLLKHRCHQFGGDFTLLWHNSHFSRAKDKEFYKELIQ
jgi:hypothetical protein